MTKAESKRASTGQGKQRRFLCATGARECKHMKSRIQIGQRPFTALINSGTQGNFISLMIVNRYKIPWEMKREPYSLSTFDGQEVIYSNGIIDMETDHLCVIFDDHDETIQFDITDTAKYELILGILWLRKINPQIDWTTGQISWDIPRDGKIKGKGSNSVPEDSSGACA